MRTFSIAVLGLKLHGALESPAVVEALVGRRPTRHLESVFDELADLVEARLDMDALERLAGGDFADRERVRTDPDFEPLRGDPRFQKLLRERRP